MVNVVTSYHLFSQVHAGGGGYDSDFSGDDEGESSEKTLKRYS